MYFTDTSFGIHVFVPSPHRFTWPTVHSLEIPTLRVFVAIRCCWLFFRLALPCFLIILSETCSARLYPYKGKSCLPESVPPTVLSNDALQSIAFFLPPSSGIWDPGAAAHSGPSQFSFVPPALAPPSHQHWTDFSLYFALHMKKNRHLYYFRICLLAQLLASNTSRLEIRALNNLLSRSLFLP